MDLIEKLAQELSIAPWQAKAAVELMDEGCTVPFIARYRKELTGSLNDEVLRALQERLKYLRGLEERKETVIASITEQGKMTPQLLEQIRQVDTLVSLEDLYRPYKPKRRTRGTIAREKGLEPLAKAIMTDRLQGTLEQEAQSYVSDGKGVQSVQEALDGAKDIIAEDISDDARIRSRIRDLTWREGMIRSEAKQEGESSVYEMYYNYEETLRKVPGHRVLALDRGEKEKILTVKIVAPEERILSWLCGLSSRMSHRDGAKLMEEAVTDSYRRLIAPSVEREIRSDLTQKAQDSAIVVFGKNLKNLLMQPPVAGHIVLGWDPAFRTGCKLAVVDPTGKVLDTTVIFPTAPTTPAKTQAAKDKLRELISRYNVSLISVGNGTASRESEQFIAAFLKELDQPVKYVIVNEAGASVYSASELATEEFPNFDVGQRSAASIARRLQDPLAELVKIDPRSIGVGQYQHDMNQKQLGEALGSVVEDCVNSVGVDLNTASVPLLSFVSGLTKTAAKNIVAHREEHGSFTSRAQLKKVKGIGPKAFEQSAGFLRIKGGSEPLDQTGVHPESYEAARALLKKLGYESDQLKKGAAVGITGKVKDKKRMAEELQIGLPTLEDILKELEKPGRDPRESLAAPVLRSDVMDLKDLKEGMILEGTVRNVIDFGAFVDIGVHQDGLVHISQITDKGFIRHPLEAVSVGDIVKVKVLGVDEKRGRTSLTMKGVEQ